MHVYSRSFLLKFAIIIVLLQALEIITTNAISLWLQMRMYTDDTKKLVNCSNCTGFSMCQFVSKSKLTSILSIFNKL